MFFNGKQRIKVIVLLIVKVIVQIVLKKKKFVRSLFLQKLRPVLVRLIFMFI